MDVSICTDVSWAPANRIPVQAPARGHQRKSTRRSFTRRFSAGYPRWVITRASAIHADANLGEMRHRSDWSRHPTDTSAGSAFSNIVGAGRLGNRQDTSFPGRSPRPRVTKALARRPISSLRVASRSMAASPRFGKELDHLFVECRRDIIGLAARDQASVHNRVLIHPIRAGIFQVGPE